MRATGIVRRIDDLGRVCIPKEIRKSIRVKEGDALEMFTTREGELVLKKYQPFIDCDWVKAKDLVCAVYPKLKFALYDDLCEFKTKTDSNFRSFCEEDEATAIINKENDVVGFAMFKDTTLQEEETVIKLLKEFFTKDN